MNLLSLVFATKIRLISFLSTGRNETTPLCSLIFVLGYIIIKLNGPMKEKKGFWSFKIGKCAHDWSWRRMNLNMNPHNHLIQHRIWLWWSRPENHHSPSLRNFSFDPNWVLEPGLNITYTRAIRPGEKGTPPIRYGKVKNSLTNRSDPF